MPGYVPRRIGGSASYQSSLAEFLSDLQAEVTMIAAEVAAAAIMTAVRATVRVWLLDPSVQPTATFREAVGLLTLNHPQLAPARRIAIIETDLGPECSPSQTDRMTRRRSSAERFATSPSNANVSHACGTAGCTCSSMGTPAFASRSAYSMSSSRKMSSSPTSM